MSADDMGMYLDDSRLAQFAENTARRIKKTYYVSGSGSVKLIKSALKNVRSTHELATKKFSDSLELPVAIEWLLDNWYIAIREGADAARSFRHVHTLRKADGGEEPALIIEAASALLRAGENYIDEERISIFLESFQKVIIFTEKELALFVPSLKIALVEELGRLCDNIKSMIKKANAKPEILQVSGEMQNLQHLYERIGCLIGNVFTSLRVLANLNLTDIIENVSYVEQILKQDPTGEYLKMDDRTRQYYRYTISRVSAQNGIQEHKAAEKILSLAKKGAGENAHVGYYIFTAPLGKQKNKCSGSAYIAAIVLSSVVLTLLMGFITGNAIVFCLLLFPTWTTIKNLLDFFLVRLISPAFIPRMELKSGVPARGKTLCVISTMLSSGKNGEELTRKIEEYKLANIDAGNEVLFGILADLPESESESLESDKESIEGAIEQISELNAEYNGGFFLLIRKRSYNERDKKYMGWERKRGAILELVRFLKNEKTGVECAAGDKAMLKGVRYIITLDSDTRLCISSAKEMIGAMLHPLNRPVVNEKTSVVIRGRALMQPKVSVSLESSDATDFSRIFAGQGGIDPYGSSSSDIYQDLFGRGTFTGKGIIDIDAYYKCLNERFPENCILSHDLLEGEFLNAAYISDVEMLDSFPSGIRVYFERMHRWIRGDWQAAPWMFGRIKDANGEKYKNPLGQISRFKIFDNLVRSLSPIFIFLALMLGMLTTKSVFIASAVIAIIASASNLLLSSAEMIVRRGPGGRLRYHSTIISGFAGALMQTMLQLIILPYKAYISFTAIVVALFRMLISKKNMLSWVTAAQSEGRKKDSLVSYYMKMFVSLLAGCVLIVFSIYPVASAVGIIWILAPLFAWSLCRRDVQRENISSNSASFLKQCAKDIWKYFDELLLPEDNYLPPDNWQEQPAVGTAHRTSPTNIGLAILAAICANDMEICSEERCIELVERMVSSLECLPKWNGNLYNWYDCKSMQPLKPAYVSTVDSGNLIGCLIAAEYALREFKYKKAETIAKRVKSLHEAMRLLPLYDNKRKLFYIGFDTEKNEPTQGWYDLMASEARQTSYIAVARGEVDKKHWRKLGRMLAVQDRYSGMVSWTGTMFEYLMPNLLLPCKRNSLIYESSKFCVYVQKKKTKKNKPWGVSESAFYAFDSSMSYMYKAHGMERLALKRGMGKDDVISPYSSFLALEMARNDAIENLRLMKKLGLEGKYGFYEAIDYTPARQTTGNYEKVRTFMVHHLGMSIVAIANMLCNNVMKERFMKDRRMAAYKELLEERIPIGQTVLKLQRRETPEKPQRPENSKWSVSVSEINYYQPKCCMLSNGAYHTVLAETGKNFSLWRAMMIKRFDPQIISRDGGIRFTVDTEEKTYQLMHFAAENDEADRTAKFTASSGMIKSSFERLDASLELVVPKAEMGELWTVSLENTGDRLFNATLKCYFEPILTTMRDYQAHPLFTKVRMTADVENQSVFICRRARGESPNVWLCFVADSKIAAEVSRCAVVNRSGKNEKTCNGGKATEGDPCVYTEIKLSLQPQEKKTFRFAIAVASNKNDAGMAAQRILSTTIMQRSQRMELLASKFEVKDITKAFDILSCLLFSSEKTQNEETSAPYTDGKSGLWQFGISGDRPIALLRIEDENMLEYAYDRVREVIFIQESGFDFDFVLAMSEGGSYRKPIQTGLCELLRKLGRASGAEIHLVDISECSGLAALKANADLEFGISEDQKEKQRIICGYLPEIMKEKMVSSHEKKFKYGFNAKGEFVFELCECLPERCWSLPLANENFGYIATDTGTGHLWYRNSRENKLTPWLNDPLATRGAESIKVVRYDKKYSVFAAKDGGKCKIIYGMGCAKWEKEIDDVKFVTTVFVPRNINARVVIIEAFDKVEKVEFFVPLLLGADIQEARFVKTWEQEGALYAKNTSGKEYPDTVFSLRSNMKLEQYTCSVNSYACGKYDNVCKESRYPCFAASFQASENVCIIVSGCDSEEKLNSLCDVSNVYAELEKTEKYWRKDVGTLEVNTPSLELNEYLNGWALYQTIVCRLLGRASVYQCGGAIGFRDQLQDVCAIIPYFPEIAKKQILCAAEHQFIEGDVLHWWHVSDLGDKGVRTRCSDDLLWLPYVLCCYVCESGDVDFCETKANYLAGETLSNSENERYEKVTVSNISESIYQHAARAIDKVIERGFGKHGLAFIGTGDWNDGLDRVGIKGKGESVWLTWFIAIVTKKFIELSERLGKIENLEKYRVVVDRCLESAENAWDGKWFLRGFYDDGEKLGADGQDECSIDSVAQSFAVFAGCRDKNKVISAVKHATDALYDRDNKLVRLFTPPFNDSMREPGYIKSYAPGQRENGGQYTHGAIWLALACIKCGMVDTGAEMLLSILPYTHDNSRYKAEPYVLAGDVYSAIGSEGVCGWSWYTGAAGWYYRAAVQGLLGIRVINGCINVMPSMPDSWDAYDAQWKTDNGVLHISVMRGEKESAKLEQDEWPEKGLPINEIQGERYARFTVNSQYNDGKSTEL